MKEFQKTFTDLKLKLDDAVATKAEQANRMETLLAEKRDTEKLNAVLRGENAALSDTVKSYRKHGADQLVEEQLRALQAAARCSICNGKGGSQRRASVWFSSLFRLNFSPLCRSLQEYRADHVLSYVLSRLRK